MWLFSLPPWGLKRCNLSNFTLASALLASGAMRFGDRKRTIGQLREFVRNNQVTLRARSGDGVLQKLRTRNPDQSFNKPEKRWYSWMRDKRRTAKEKADMAELNALVNYSAGHRKQACRGCEIDGVHVECSRTSTREMLLQLDECPKAHNHGIESDEVSEC